jgi:hypothetical protein
MQKKRSIQFCGAIIALMCLVSLYQTSTETYYYMNMGANDGDVGFGLAEMVTVANRVAFSVFAFCSSVLFFNHREMGRKGMLLSTYGVLIYLGYVFFEMYESSDGWVFLLIGLGNVLLIALFIRWLHSPVIREAVQ